MPTGKIKIITALTLMAGLLIIPLPDNKTAIAADDKKITLICRQDETILNGMEWTLYRVGTREDTCIRFAPEFSKYRMDLGDLSAQAIESAAKTIEGYVVESNLSPIAHGTTDSTGELEFGGLDNGLYLATGKVLKVNEKYYVPSTLLIEVNNADASLSYDAYPKFYYATLSGEAKNYTVKKVWIDNDDLFEKRPVYVTVDLYKDGILNDTVTLNEENNWEYTWRSLDIASEWLAVEREIPVKYEVMIDYNQTQYLIKNSYNPDIPIDGGYYYKVTTTVVPNPPVTNTHTTAVSVPVTSEPPSTAPVTPSTDSSQQRTQPPQLTTISPKLTTLPPQLTTAPAQTTSTPNKLIQTGQLWWPVIPLSLGGIVLIGAGLSIRSGKKKDEK